MNSKLTLLAPQPQQVSESAGQVHLFNGLHIVLRDSAADLLPPAQRLQNVLSEHGVAAEIAAFASGAQGDVEIAVNGAICHRPQGYRLLVEPGGIFLVGADAAGAFYGICTLCQLVSLYADASGLVELPSLHIEDWPDYANRGVMLDITRDRVPTLKTLYDLVDLLASLKVNQLQLYTEHAFAYVGHEIVWQDSSPMTPEDVLMLDAYCRARDVELVPNQNSFGHMHRWLKHDAYRPLAESPEGIQHPFTPQREPYSICPTDPKSLDLLEDLFAQLLPSFSSRQVNVGLDETFDLGLGRSKQACEEQGVGHVYLEFLRKIHAIASKHGRTMQFWSDIIVRDEPELVAELPRDVIALEWGYEADYPFAEHARLIALSGRSFYVCPGTGSWNTLAGRTDNALGNLRNAAVNGAANGAIGYLNTDWGDNGHMQPLPVSYLGYLAGAAMSWNVASASPDQKPDWAAMLDAHVFQDSACVMGRLAYDMGLVYLLAGSRLHNSSPLFWLLILPDALPAHRYPADMTEERLEETLGYLDEALAPLSTAMMARADAALIVAEYQWVGDMLRWACRLGIERLKAGLDRPVEAIVPAARAQLAADLAPLIRRHRELWLQRSRPGGLHDSAGRLETMLARLGETTEA